MRWMVAVVSLAGCGSVSQPSLIEADGALTALDGSFADAGTTNDSLSIDFRTETRDLTDGDLSIVSTADSSSLPDMLSTDMGPHCYPTVVDGGLCGCTGLPCCKNGTNCGSASVNSPYEDEQCESTPNGNQCFDCGGMGEECCAGGPQGLSTPYCRVGTCGGQSKCVPCGELNQPCCSPNASCDKGLHCFFQAGLTYCLM